MGHSRAALPLSRKACAQEMDPSIRELFAARNRNRKREQGGVATLTAMRRTEDGERKPSHAQVTWQADIMDMSTRGGQASHALLAVDVGTRQVWGELMRGRSSEEAVWLMSRPNRLITAAELS